MAFRRSRLHRLVPLALLALGLLLLAHLQLKTLEPPQPAAASSSSLPPARELPISRPQAHSLAATWPRPGGLSQTRPRN